MAANHRPRGFTLIELMIVVVIVAILAAIAFPSYQEHLRKGRRGATQAFIMNLADREQQYLLDARTYATGPSALTTLNVPVPSDVSSFYTVTIDPAAPTTPPSYTITATPLGLQASDGVLTLDQAGNKTRAGNPGW
jgi:type IV pilus assembly protein PilE